VTFFVDTDPKKCLERIHATRFGFELFEEEKKLKSVREVYLDLVKKHNFVRINGDVSEDEIGNEAIGEIKKIMKEKEFSLQKFL
jgi:thymidylate kinase